MRSTTSNLVALIQAPAARTRIAGSRPPIWRRFRGASPISDGSRGHRSLLHHTKNSVPCHTTLPRVPGGDATPRNGYNQHETARDADTRPHFQGVRLAAAGQTAARHGEDGRTGPMNRRRPPTSRVTHSSPRRRHTASLAFCGARSFVLLAFFPTG